MNHEWINDVTRGFFYQIFILIVCWRLVLHEYFKLILALPFLKYPCLSRLLHETFYSIGAPSSYEMMDAVLQ